MKKIIMLLILLVTTCGMTLVHAEANYVQDKAELLSQSEKQNLNQMLNELATSKTKLGEDAKLEYAILTVKSLNHKDIEDYARDVFNQKQIGDRQHNLGVLFVIASEDHEYRIQLGDGWNKTKYVNESNIKRWVYTDSVTDMLRSDNYGQAIETITENMIALIGQEVVLPQSQDSFAQALSVRMDQKKIRDEKITSILINLVLAISCLGVILLGAISLRQLAKKRYLKKNRELVKSILQIELGFYAEEERLAISDDQLADAFNETKLPPSLDNIQMFLDNFKWHDALINQGDQQYKKKRSRQEREKIALRVTQKYPKRRYHDFNEMNHSFRQDRFWRNYYYATLLYPTTQAQTVHANNDHSDSDNNSSSWTDFGGGGGFSSGGGASGSW